MLSRLSVCGIYPSKSCLHRSASSLLRVLSGEFPAFSGTIGRLRLLTAIPPHFVSFAWQYTDVSVYILRFIFTLNLKSAFVPNRLAFVYRAQRGR